MIIYLWICDHGKIEIKYVLYQFYLPPDRDNLLWLSSPINLRTLLFTSANLLLAIVLENLVNEFKITDLALMKTG
jgi:hypothetical protein